MWLVWRRGSPDPSRPSPAIHYDDPAKDRDTSDRLYRPILIAPAHRGMTLRELLTIDAYNLPASVRATIEGEATRAVCDADKRIPTTAEA